MNLCSEGKARKIQIVKDTIDSLGQHTTGYSTVVLAKFEQMTVSDMNALRKEAYDMCATIKVIKAKLLKRAFASMEGLEALAEACSGQVMLICSNNGISATSLAVGAGKNLTPIVGYLENRVLDAEVISNLGGCKSVNMVYAKVAFAIKGACSRVARVIRAVAAK